VKEDLYDGVPVVELPITVVDVPDPGHLRRSRRYPGPIDIPPDAAIEAALDPAALIARDPRSRTVRPSGWSGSPRSSGGCWSSC